MSVVDLIVLVWLLAWCAVGLARGMTEQVLSLGGLALGAVLGGRLVPAIAGDRIPGEWLPLAALGGALVGAVLVQSLLLRAATPLRLAVRRGPLRPFDAGGGLIVGGALGLAVAWLVASVLVYQAGDRAGSAIREQVQRSAILTRALETVPPDRLITALARLDPLPLVPLAPEALPPPDDSVLADPQAAAARERVVQIRGRACGVGLSGSGWVVGQDLIATNAHVVAGIPAPEVLVPDGRRLEGTPVYIDRVDDVALVRAEGLGLRPLTLGDAPGGATAVVLLGYPGGGALQAEAATAGPESAVLAPGVDGGRHLRSVVTVRGTLGAGSSGGPVVDRDGEVVAMIFGGTPGRDATAAVPPDEIRDGLVSAVRPVDPGACVA